MAGCDAGWNNPKGGVPPPPSQLSKETHAGFAHVASMLVGQGIVDPAGEQHLTSVLVDFFEARMVRLPVMTPGLLGVTSADFHLCHSGNLLAHIRA